MKSLADLFNSSSVDDVLMGGTVDPVTGKYLWGGGPSGEVAPDEGRYLASVRRLYKIPSQVSDSQVKQWSQTELPQLIEEASRRKGNGGFMDQMMEFGSPIAYIGASALGGPVAGTIAAANGSGATSALGIDPRLTTAGSLAYGAYNAPNLGSTPNADVAGSAYGVVSNAPVNPDYWNNTYAANNTGTMTDAGTGEPGMWDWLDSLDSNTPFSTNPSFSDLGGNIDSSTGFEFGQTPGVGDAGAFDQTGSLTGATDISGNPTNDSIFGGTSNNPFGNTSILDVFKKYGAQGLNALKGLRGGNGGGNGQSTGGGILDSILGDPVGAAFNSAPFLLAMNEANKQSGDLNGVLNQINGDAYTKSVLNPYDKDTGQGRYAMQNDQALRGVSGSSFGDQALSGYDYTRALGRSDMASKAQLAAAGLQGSLINTRNTNKNLLLGAGLSASGSLFKPQQDPFNLRALLGV